MYSITNYPKKIIVVTPRVVSYKPFTNNVQYTIHLKYYDINTIFNDSTGQQIWQCSLIERQCEHRLCPAQAFINMVYFDPSMDKL